MKEKDIAGYSKEQDIDYYAKRAITDLKKAIKELAWQGEDLHAGLLLDLSAILSKIIWTYEHKGIHHTLQKYTPELL